MLDSKGAKVAAGICAGLAIILSLFQIFMHLRYYTEPLFQRYIVRLISMVPIYALASFLGLVWRDDSVYYDTIRDIYEAFVIYTFLALLLAYVGGPSAVVIKLEGKLFHPTMASMTCCLPSVPINGKFLRKCKQGTLQFVWVKPILAAVVLGLFAKGHYDEGNWGFDEAYLYIQIVYNISYTLALYSLLVFYLGTEELLKPFKPVLKFVLIKSVVFLTFWQGLIISIVGSTTSLSREDSKALQDFLVCVEMVAAAVCMLFAFPYHAYRISGFGGNLRGGNIMHAVSVHDVVSDTVHQFAPAYHDYVLYSDRDQSNDDHPRKHYKLRTFVAVGQETSQRHDASNLLANMDLGTQATFVGKSAKPDGDAPAAPGTPQRPVPAEDSQHGQHGKSRQDSKGSGTGTGEWDKIDL